MVAFHHLKMETAWWFGTFINFPFHIWDVILPKVLVQAPPRFVTVRAAWCHRLSGILVNPTGFSIFDIFETFRPLFTAIEFADEVAFALFGQGISFGFFWTCTVGIDFLPPSLHFWSTSTGSALADSDPFFAIQPTGTAPIDSDFVHRSFWFCTGLTVDFLQIYNSQFYFLALHWPTVKFSWLCTGLQ